VLDFSIGSRVLPTQGVQRKHAAPVQREEKVVTPVEQDENAVPVKQEQQDIPAPATPQTAEVRQGDDGEQGSVASGGDSGEAIKENYIAAQFVSIRDRILRSLVYPLVARRMGWAGRVKVAFTVLEDGNVEDISVIESSGFTVLDKNAIETIKKCCPLPKPPMKVALIMPVVYRLE
jgi:protein TonB